MLYNFLCEHNLAMHIADYALSYLFKEIFPDSRITYGFFVCHFVQFYYEGFLSKYEKQDFSYSIKSSSYTQCGNTDPTDFSEIILALATFSYLANAVIHMNCQQIANYAYLVYKCSPTWLRCDYNLILPSKPLWKWLYVFYMFSKQCCSKAETFKNFTSCTLWQILTNALSTGPTTSKR